MARHRDLPGGLRHVAATFSQSYLQAAELGRMARQPELPPRRRRLRPAGARRYDSAASLLEASRKIRELEASLAGHSEQSRELYQLADVVWPIMATDPLDELALERRSRA